MCNFRVRQWQASDYSSVLCAEWSLLQLDLQIWVSSCNTEYKDMLKKYVQIYIERDYVTLFFVLIEQSTFSVEICSWDRFFRMINLLNIWEEHVYLNIFKDCAVVCWCVEWTKLTIYLITMLCWISLHTVHCVASGTKASISIDTTASKMSQIHYLRQINQVILGTYHGFAMREVSVNSTTLHETN